MNDEFESPIDKIIREARERGAFDHLPGKGKPQRWEDDSQTPEDERLAHRLLKNNGFVPGWIELSRELDAAYERIVEEFEQARRRFQAGDSGGPDWLAAQEIFRDKIRALNLRVVGFNLRAPNEHFHKRHFRVDLPET